jgi:hypothetical protein
MKSQNNNTGSGVLIIEKIKNKNVFVLIGDKKKKIYEEPGGTKDYDELPEYTAFRECREETSNLFNFYPSKLNKYAKKVTLKDYVCYIIYIQEININNYEHNQKIVNKLCKPDEWKEHDSITRIYVDSITNNNQKNSIKDIYNNTIKLRKRTSDIINKYSKEINEIIDNMKPIKLVMSEEKNEFMRCINNTHKYEIYDIFEVIVLSNNFYILLGCVQIANIKKLINKLEHVSFSGNIRWKINKNNIFDNNKFTSKTLINIQKFLNISPNNGNIFVINNDNNANIGDMMNMHWSYAIRDINNNDIYPHRFTVNMN